MHRKFGDILQFHLDRGTRPQGNTKRWKKKEFAGVCDVSYNTVVSWLNEIHRPPNLGVIEIALFGERADEDDPQYREWRREMAEAYRRPKEPKRLDEQLVSERDSTEITELLSEQRDYLASRWRESDSSSSDFKRIESAVQAAYFATEAEVRILSIGNNWPSYHFVKERSELGKVAWSNFKYVPRPAGDPDADEKSLIKVGYKSSIFDFNPNRNEIIGLLVGSADNYQRFELYPIKFHTKLALIEEGLPHACISGGCLTVDADGTRLYTHRRALGKGRVVEGGGKKHTFCGSMIVKGTQLSPFEADGSLRRAAERETREESWGEPNTTSGKVASIWWCETKNHSGNMLVHEGLDVVCLGAKFPRDSELLTFERYKSHCDTLGQTDVWPEGYVEERLITPALLITELTEKATSWFPAGFAHILMWIAMGAPGATSLSESDCRNIQDQVFAHYGV